MIHASRFLSRVSFCTSFYIKRANPDTGRFANALYDFARPAAEPLPRPKRRARSYEDARQPFDQPKPKPLRSHKNFPATEPPPDDLAEQIYNLKIGMSELLGRQYPSGLSLADLRLYRRKGLARFKKFSLNSTGQVDSDQANKDLNQARLTAISYGNVANWDELNEGMLRDKIECIICYNMIFIHSSISSHVYPYTCQSCASSLVCYHCKSQIKRCPMCKAGSFVQVHPMLLFEIQKMKFYCPNKCEKKEGMTPSQLFQHMSRKCSRRDKINHYTVRVRDLQLCRFFCEKNGQNTKLVLEFLPNAVDKTHVFEKYNCECIKDHSSTGALMRRQCSRHFRSLTFPKDRFRIKDETFRPLFEELKCYLCSGLPTIPRVCSYCESCVLCLRCARDNFIRHDQCPKCSLAQPHFIPFPLNLYSILNQVEVQCPKCVDQFIASQGDDEKGNSSGLNLDEDPPPNATETEETRILKILRTSVGPEISVTWMPYSEYFGHLKNCSACPSCSFFCKHCSSNIRYAERENHLKGKACIKLEGISLILKGNQRVRFDRRVLIPNEERNLQRLQNNNIEQQNARGQQNNIRRQNPQGPQINNPQPNPPRQENNPPEPNPQVPQNNIQVQNPQRPQISAWKQYCERVKFLTQIYFHPRTNFDPSFKHKLYYTPLVLEALDFTFFLLLLVLGFQIIGTTSDGDLPPNWSSSSFRQLFQVCFFGYFGLILGIQIGLTLFISCGPGYREAHQPALIPKLGVIFVALLSLIQAQWLFFLLSGRVLFKYNSRNHNDFIVVREISFFIRLLISFLQLLMAFSILGLNSDNEDFDEKQMSFAEKLYLWLLLAYSLTCIPVYLFFYLSKR